MKYMIVAVLIASLMLVCLCVDNKENTKSSIPSTTVPEKEPAVTSTTLADGKEKCVSFSCNGNIETRTEKDNSNVAYCDGAQKARITCSPEEGAYTSTEEYTDQYSLCCTKGGANPSMPTCDRCNRKTPCGEKSGQMRCLCEDVNEDGGYEFCMFGPDWCDRCSDRTACGQLNGKKELCKCEGSISIGKAGHEGEGRKYADCSLIQTCDACSDGTLCGEKNNASEMCECVPAAGQYETCRLKRQMS
jgi:hypothetical protein